MGFLFSFFYFKISELSNSEVLFSLNVAPTPYKFSKVFFWIKLQSYTTSNVTQKIYFYILIVLFTPNWMLESSEKFSLSLCQSFIDQHWMKGEEDCKSVTFVLATIVGSKNKSIHLRDFKDVDFNFTHFANCLFWNWRKFWFNLGKITKWPISLANFHFGYIKKCSFPV